MYLIVSFLTQVRKLKKLKNNIVCTIPEEPFNEVNNFLSKQSIVEKILFYLF